MANARKPINLKKGGLVWSIWNFVEALTLITLGVITIINSNNGSFQSLLFLLLSIVMMAAGAFRIVTNFLPVITCAKVEHETKEMVRSKISYDLAIFGACELTLGIVLCMNYASIFNTVKNLILSTTSVLLIVAGATLIIFAVAFIIAKFYKLYLPILEIILGVVLLALGIIILILKEDILFKIFFFVLGLVLIVGGVSEVVTTIKVISKQKPKKTETTKKEKEDAVEVEVIEKKKKDSEDKKSKKEKK